MLTEKYKDFIERTAKKIQRSLPSFEAPNKYDFSEVHNWLKGSGAQISCGATNRTMGNVIYLNFIKSEKDFAKAITNDFEKSKILFHEMWHFISNKLYAIENGDELSEKNSVDLCGEFADKSISPIEISANYFSRAMLFPEKEFVQTVMQNVDVNGNCDIFKVAECFSSSYTDVIARGNDLNLWNTKVG